MKRIFIIFVSLVLGTTVFGQKGNSGEKKDPVWFNLEAKGGLGTCMLYNGNILGDDHINIYNFKPYGAFNIGLGVHFTKGFAIQFERDWNNFTQKYTYDLPSYPDYEIKFNTTEWGMYLRGTSEGGSFVGIGIKLARLHKVIINGADSAGMFRQDVPFGLFEAGGPLWSTNIFDINLSVRFGFCILDVVDNGNYQPGAYTTYPSYSRTYPATAQLLIGFNWHIGHFATSNCKHRGFVFFTN
jgi:hypothetical protein